MSATYLADTSAWHRSGATPAVRERWVELVLDGRLAMCSPVRLEILYSARSSSDYVALDSELRELPELRLDSEAAERAEAVQSLLTARGQHRAPTPAHLYVAAVAEVNDATLLHYDRHFDAIAQVTGQPAEWIAPRGTLD